MVEIKINGKHEGYFENRFDASVYICVRYYGMSKDAAILTMPVFLEEDISLSNEPMYLTYHEVTI